MGYPKLFPNFSIITAAAGGARGPGMRSGGQRRDQGGPGLGPGGATAGARGGHGSPGPLDGFGLWASPSGWTSPLILLRFAPSIDKFGPYHYFSIPSPMKSCTQINDITRTHTLDLTLQRAGIYRHEHGLFLTWPFGASVSNLQKFVRQLKLELVGVTIVVHW